MFTKMALEETVDIRANEDARADNPIGGIIVFSIDIFLSAVCCFNLRGSNACP